MIILTSLIFPWQEWIEANEWVFPVVSWAFIISTGLALSLLFKTRLLFLVCIIPISITMYLNMLPFTQALIAVMVVIAIAMIPWDRNKPSKTDGGSK